MKYIQEILKNLDDILVGFALISFVTASYFVNAVLGTYILGVAFLVIAFFAGMWLRSSMAVKIISKFQKRK